MLQHNLIELLTFKPTCVDDKYLDLGFGLRHAVEDLDRSFYTQAITGGACPIIRSDNKDLRYFYILGESLNRLGWAAIKNIRYKDIRLLD